MNVEFLPWAALGDAPNEPGLYAWYYNPRISSTTVDNLIAAVETEDGPGTEAANARVRAFLEEQVFTRLRAPAYSASLSGPLRPTYEGRLEMASAVSNSLVQRLAAQPQRVRGIAAALAGMAPHFASPLYIGMARRLRDRLAQHKARVLEIAQAQAELGDRSFGDLSQTADTSFALEVARRGIPYTALWVAVGQLPGLGEPVDVENVLNRLNHPLFGKN
jgi:hypothetical protein